MSCEDRALKVFDEVWGTLGDEPGCSIGAVWAVVLGRSELFREIAEVNIRLMVSTWPGRTKQRSMGSTERLNGISGRRTGLCSASAKGCQERLLAVHVPTDRVQGPAQK